MHKLDKKVKAVLAEAEKVLEREMDGRGISDKKLRKAIRRSRVRRNSHCT